MVSAQPTISLDGQALSLPAIAAVSDCISTTRAVRRFHSAEVEPELIEFVLQHAIQAGSAKNRQPWRFVVVRDSDQRARLRQWYRRGYQDLAAWAGTADVRREAPPDERRQMAAAAELATHFDDVPAVIAVCFVPTKRNPANFFGGASIYPATQNLLLAARAVGLGATITTLHALGSVTPDGTLNDQLKHILGIPPEIVPAALIPLGWPVKPFTTARRTPIPEITYQERWGTPWNS
jgi:nitroreductase